MVEMLSNSGNAKQVILKNAEECWAELASSAENYWTLLSIIKEILDAKETRDTTYYNEWHFRRTLGLGEKSGF